MSGLSEEGRLRKCSPEIRQWYHELEAYCISLGKDVTKRLRVAYIGFWRSEVFAYVNLRTSHNRIVIDFRLARAQANQSWDSLQSKKIG